MVNITHDSKIKCFTIECDKKKEIIRKISWQNLLMGTTYAKMIVNRWNLKLQTNLRRDGIHFSLELNN